MIKLPDEKVIHDGKSEKARQRCEGWNECIAEVQRLNATAQPVSNKPSLKAMMRALDEFYANEDVPESGMLIAFRILLADVITAAPGGQDDET